MATHNAANERVKRDYFAFLEHAKGRDTATIDRVAKSLVRFEETTGHRAFAKFRREQAIAFKRRLADQSSAHSGERLSKATQQSTLRDLKAFFEWLAREPGFAAKIAYIDADYFNLSEKDAAIARTKRERPFPELMQIEAALVAMPATTPLERRDRALIAFTTITAVRVNALRTLRLGHVDTKRGHVDQDARTVATKFGKTIGTVFMPVSDMATAIVREWCSELREQHGWGMADPLFPATAMGLSATGEFEPQGLARKHWQSTGPIRDVFRRAFAAADLPYFNPHSFRHTLVHHAMRLELGPEAMKAWSQNLGHASVLTTFTSYGNVPAHRQGELIRAVGAQTIKDPLDDPDIRALIGKIRAKAS